jgi:hypothetical protein
MNDDENRESAVREKGASPAPAEPLCMCKDRVLSKCPGEWEPGCDLGANEKYAQGAPSPAGEREPAITDEQALALATEHGAGTMLLPTQRAAAIARGREAYARLLAVHPAAQPAAPSSTHEEGA